MYTFCILLPPSKGVEDSSGKQRRQERPDRQKARYFLVNSPILGGFEVVPEGGLEPSCPCGRQILSLLRLPFRHSGPEQAHVIHEPDRPLQDDTEPHALELGRMRLEA